MESYRHFQDDLYHPKLLFKIAFQFGDEVAHAFPAPDQLGWLVSFPLVFVPFLSIAVAYANGYYVTIGFLWVGEKITIRLERLWHNRLVEYWEEYVPQKYREAVEEVMPDVEVEAHVTEEEQERRREKLRKQLEERGKGQKNVTKDSDDGISFKNN